MMQVNTDLIGVRPAQGISEAQAFEAGMKLKAARRQEEKLNTAKAIFSKNGINEQSIDEYARTTGDVEGAQTMLQKYRTDETMRSNLQTLEDAHSEAIINQAKLQDDLVLQSYSSLASVLDGIDWNDASPEGLLKRKASWAFARKVGSQLANYDDKNNLTRGFELPEEPDANVAAALINNGKTMAQRLNEQKQQFDEWSSKKKLELDERRLDLDRWKAAIEAKKLNQPKEPKELTADTRKWAKYASTVNRGLRNMEKLVAEGFDEGSIVNQVLTRFEKKEEMPVADFLALAKTPEQRRYLQAQLDFMIPDLRMQSGAVINKSEYIMFVHQFFPTFGEPAESVAQKRQARIEEGIAYETLAGDAYRAVQDAINRKREISKIDPADLQDVNNWLKELGITE